MQNNNSLEENNTEKKYTSSGILLEMARDEYTKEKERGDALDNKASFFITIIIAIATIFVPLVPYKQFVKLYQFGTCVQKGITSFLTCCIVVAFILLVLAYKNLYDSYKLVEYKRPNPDCINIEDNHTISNELLNKGLCDHYKTIVDYNTTVNDKKCMSIANGLKLSGIGFLILLITTIGLLIVVGG